MAMHWMELEQAFQRAVLLSLSKRRCVLAFSALALCGLLIVFCRAVAFETGDWLAMSFAFLPVLVSSGVLLVLGVLLIRMHRQHTFGIKELLTASSNLLVGTFYLSVPSILVYLCLWVALGVFFLFRSIPLIGEFFSAILAFGPFLLLLSSLLLCFCNLGLLFFVTPAVALQSLDSASLAKQVLGRLKQWPLSSLVLFAIALLPCGVLVILSSYAAHLTSLTFSAAEHSFSVALEWFFIMLPFCAILTPAVVFFFNFAAESYQLLRPLSKATYSRPREQAMK